MDIETILYIPKYKNYILKKKVKNKKILQILKKFNINENIESISEKILRKFIITFSTKKKKSTKYIVKICMSNFALKLNTNEENGYNFFKNINIFNIKFPNYKRVSKTNSVSVHKIRFIDGTQLSYNEFPKLKPLFNKSTNFKKKINLNKYFKVMRNNFEKLYNFFAE